MNLLLIESDYFVNENCLLPKSLYVCMIRFEGETSIARGEEELQQDDQTLICNVSKCAREAGAQGWKESNFGSDRQNL